MLRIPLRPTHLMLALVVTIALLPARLAAAQLPGAPPFRILPPELTGSPMLSANGHYLAFASPDDSLVPGDTNQAVDVFVYDLLEGRIQRVSVSSSGAQAEAASRQPAISADGRYIAFISWAANLDNLEDSGHPPANVFVHDRLSGETQRVSRASGGAAADGWSGWPAISGDGRLIAFISLAGNLADPESLPGAGIYVAGWQDGQIERIAVPGAGWVQRLAFSSDGRFVAFTAAASPTPAGQTRLYLHDRLTGRTRLALPPGDETALRVSAGPLSLSAGGEVLAFAARPDGQPAVYLYDRILDKFQPIPDSKPPFSLAPNGRWAAYISYAQEAAGQAARYDRLSGQVQIFAEPGASGQDPWSREQPAVSAAGDVLVFPARQSAASPVRMAEIRPAPKEAAQQPYGWISGWVSDGAGHPLAGITLLDSRGRATTTGPDGGFRLDGLYSGVYTLTPSQEGYSFSPPVRRITLSTNSPGASGLAFSASPEGVVQAAQESIGMPYALSRGCPSPFEPCGGPFHGFYRGDCTDLILDAYRVGAEIDLQLALKRDAWSRPDHFYRWRNARSAHDMWRYFSYTGQMLDHSLPYQIGDIVFFDWGSDAVIDHVALVSEIGRRGRPQRLIDATGTTEENPSGLTAELDWQSYHDDHVVGHARWFGGDQTDRAALDARAPALLVALDAPDARLRLINAQGQAVGAAIHSIPGSSFQEFGREAVASLVFAEPVSASYQIEIRASAETPALLAVQTVQDRSIVTTREYELTLRAGEILRLPLQLQVHDGRLTFLNIFPD